MGNPINDLMSEYYAESTCERLGQYFVNTYIKRRDVTVEGIFNEGDINKARVMISQFMEKNQWHTLPKKLRDDQPTASRFIKLEEEK